MPKSSCLNGLLWSFEESTISDLESSSNFQVKEEKKFKSSKNNEIGLLWSRQSFGESTISDFESPSNFQVKEKKIFKSVQKQRNWTVVDI